MDCLLDQIKIEHRYAGKREQLLSAQSVPTKRFEHIEFDAALVGRFIPAHISAPSRVRIDNNIILHRVLAAGRRRYGLQCVSKCCACAISKVIVPHYPKVRDTREPIENIGRYWRSLMKKPRQF